MADPPSPSEPQRKLGLTMMTLAWLILLGLLAVYFDHWISDRANPNRTPATVNTPGGVEVILRANPQHHYLVSGSINGYPVTFLLDTGASEVVVPATVAKHIGLTEGMPSIATTANGRVTVYSTALKSVAIGGIHFSDIQASINPGLKEPVVLLGMSALHRIAFSQRGDMLVLRQQQD